MKPLDQADLLDRLLFRPLVTLQLVQLRVGSQLLYQLRHDSSADVPRDAQAPNLRLCLNGGQHQGSSCIACKQGAQAKYIVVICGK